MPESFGEPLDALVEEGPEDHDGERALLEEVDGAQPDGEHAEADDDDARQEGGAPHHRAVGLAWQGGNYVRVVRFHDSKLHVRSFFRYQICG